MTRLQFDRWHRLSLRLLRAYRTTAHRRERLTAEIRWFFDFLAREDFWQGMISWDLSEDGTPYCCDLIPDVFDGYNCYSEKREDEGRFYSQLSSCIHAGLDIAAEPSAGVIGFTVEDVRRAFDWHIPKWFTELYPGVAEGKASEGVWL